jgi:uncharacterized membrane protein YeaQ/YmgE (transglycosylase-associated protein family)
VELLAALLGLAVQGLIVGALARLAIPGPDPMPWWLTIGTGLVGAFVGGGLGYALAGVGGYFVGAVVFASLLIVAYRRVVQRRGITGPSAREQPRRGFGLRRRRS